MAKEMKKSALKAKKAVEEQVDEIIEEVSEKATEAKANFTETITEKATDAKANFTETITQATEKTISFFDPITRRVRDVVLGLGEIIVTIVVLVGVIAAIIGGFSDMSTVGFFAGLTSIIKGIVGIIMGALVIFLLFDIKKNLEK